MFNNIIHSKFSSALLMDGRIGKKVSISCYDNPASGYDQHANARDYLLDLINILKMSWAESLIPGSELIGMFCESREIHAAGQDTRKYIR